MPKSHMYEWQPVDIKDEYSLSSSQNFASWIWTGIGQFLVLAFLLPGIPCEGMPPSLSNSKLSPRSPSILMSSVLREFFQEYVFLSCLSAFTEVVPSWFCSGIIVTDEKVAFSCLLYCCVLGNYGHILKMLHILISAVFCSSGTATPFGIVSCFCPGVISYYFDNTVYLLNS
jgi:hypothetical protein